MSSACAPTAPGGVRYLKATFFACQGKKKQQAWVTMHFDETTHVEDVLRNVCDHCTENLQSTLDDDVQKLQVYFVRLDVPDPCADERYVYMSAMSTLCALPEFKAAATAVVVGPQQESSQRAPIVLAVTSKKKAKKLHKLEITEDGGAFLAVQKSFCSYTLPTAMATKRQLEAPQNAAASSAPAAQPVISGAARVVTPLLDSSPPPPPTLPSPKLNPSAPPPTPQQNSRPLNTSFTSLTAAGTSTSSIPKSPGGGRPDPRVTVVYLSPLGYKGIVDVLYKRGETVGEVIDATCATLMSESRPELELDANVMSLLYKKSSGKIRSMCRTEMMPVDDKKREPVTVYLAVDASLPASPQGLGGRRSSSQGGTPRADSNRRDSASSSRRRRGSSPTQLKAEQERTTSDRDVAFEAISALNDCRKKCKVLHKEWVAWGARNEEVASELQAAKRKKDALLHDVMAAKAAEGECRSLESFVSFLEAQLAANNS